MGEGTAVYQSSHREKLGNSTLRYMCERKREAIVLAYACDDIKDLLEY